MTRNELLRAWVEDLRSGSYVQGDSCLQRDGKYCCLGVLCEVSRMGWWQHEYNATPFSAYIVGDWTPESGIPPKPVLELAGLLDDNDTVPLSAQWFAAMNDKRRLTFAQIADEVERAFPDVFAEGR